MQDLTWRCHGWCYFNQLYFVRIPLADVCLCACVYFQILTLLHGRCFSSFCRDFAFRAEREKSSQLMCTYTSSEIMATYHTDVFEDLVDTMKTTRK